MKLEQAIQEFNIDRISDISAPTRELYRITFASLAQALGAETELKAVSASDLRRWAAGLHDRKPALSPYTIHRYIRQAKTFFTWCVSAGFIAVSPAAGLRRPKLPAEPPKAVDPLDLAAMLDAARLGSTRDYAIIRFLAETGCRLGGLLSLTADAIDLDNNLAIVREKGQKSRRVPFGEETGRVLAQWLIERRSYLPGGPLRDRGCKRPYDRLFIGRRGNLTKSGVYRILKLLAKAADVHGRFNPHAFRHGLARRLLSNKADLGTVSRILGHKSIEVTHQFYAVWSENELWDRYREFGGIIDD